MELGLMSRDSTLGAVLTDDCHNTESHARKAKYIVKVSQDALGELKMKCQQ